MLIPGKSPDETGIALLAALIALSIFSLLGLYMTFNATTGLHISDNHESRFQATYAAQGGLNHARVLLRGLVFNDLLKGPDGLYSESPSYMEQAKSFEFRNPLPLVPAHSLNIFDPSADISGISDDGLINTGFYGGINGIVLIPLTGISQVAPNPYGAGTIVTSRYFVKVTDNSGEASEVAGDSKDNPFIDGDGIVILRSMGVARTISESTGSIWRRNSVVVFEGRYKRLSTFDLGPALIVQGDQVDASFDGMYEISGGLFPGIGVLDTDPDNAVFPEQLIQQAAGENANITGGGLPKPSVQDITGPILSNADQSLLLKPGYLWDFIHNRAPRWSDNYYDSDQNWTEGSAPYAGAYDLTKPVNAPGQDPRIIMVNGDLQVTGNFSGGGLLIVTGNFSYTGSFAYNGLILLIGSGQLTAAGMGPGIAGGVLLANLTNADGEIGFGIPKVVISGDSRIAANREAVKMAVGLMPPSQISFREIAGSDP